MMEGGLFAKGPERTWEECYDIRLSRPAAFDQYVR